MQALGHDTKGLDQLDATSCADMFRPCCPSQDPSLIRSSTHRKYGAAAARSKRCREMRLAPGLDRRSPPKNVAARTRVAANVVGEENSI